jgi:hypothetical protein
MVQIPTYQAQQGLDAPSYPTPSLDNSIGEALGAVGNALSSAGNTLGDLAAWQRNKALQENRSDAQIKMEALNEELNQDLIEAERNAPANGRGLYEGFTQKSLTPKTQAFLSSIPDAGVREEYAKRLPVLQQKWANEGVNREYALGNKYSSEQVASMGEARLRGVAENPAALKDYEAEYDEIVDNMPSLTSAQREAYKRKFREAAPSIVAESLKETDPGSFKFATGNGTHAERLQFLSERLLPAIQMAENARGDPNVISSAGAVGLMQVVPGSAGVEVAKRLGDDAFLSMSQAERVAFLQNPDSNVLYGTTYLNMMLEKYEGDAEAALIAYNAGPGNADKWLAAGRDYAALPKRSETEPYVRGIFESLGTAKLASGKRTTGGTPGARLPLKVGSQPGRQPLDMSGLSRDLVDKWEQVQGAFGQQVTIVSAFRDPVRNARAGGASKSRHLHGDAIDVDVRNMGKAERLRLIETASSLGFNGIGIYNNSLHFDLGGRRAWGQTHSAASVPAWASAAVARHMAGKASASGTQYASRSGFVSDAFNDMPISELQKAQASGANMTTVERDRQKMAEQAAKIEASRAMDDDLASIASSGQTLIPPGETDAFEEQILKTHGLDALAKFQEDRLVAQNVYDMTQDIGQMSDAALAARLAEMSAPISGEGAALKQRIAEGVAKGIEGEISERKASAAEQERLAKESEAVTATRQRSIEGVKKAIEAVRKERDTDPASAALKYFPEVADAWANAKDEVSTQAALTATVLAQEKMGVPGDKINPLPADHAKVIADRVLDETLPPETRIAELTRTIAMTPDPRQQEQIIRQMVKTGLTPKIANVVEAWKRNDVGATRRLFQAAMLDSSKAPKLGANDNTLGAAVEEALLGADTIGAEFYGLDLGDPRMAEVASSDLELAKSAVRLAMAAGMSQDAAIEQAEADIFGPVQALSTGLVNGGSVKGLAPSDVDTEKLLRGFDAANTKMVDVLQGYVARAYGQLPANATPEMQAIYRASHINETNRILSEGVWRNNGDGWSLFDPQTKGFIGDDTGKPILFSTDQLIEMGGGTPGASVPQRGEPDMFNTAPPAQPSGEGGFGMPPEPAPGKQGSLRIPAAPDTSLVGGLKAQGKTLAANGPLNDGSLQNIVSPAILSGLT